MNQTEKDNKETLLKQLEQYVEDNEAEKAYQMLNDMHINYPHDDWEDFSHYLIYSAVEQRSLALLKVLKHPIFLEADNEHAYENLRTRVAQTVASEKAYDFIAPTILANLATMADYMFEMINEVNSELCQYVLDDEMLDFDYEHLQKAYPTIFSLQNNDVLNIANIFSPMIQMNDSVMRECITNAVNKTNSSSITYLIDNYPEQMLDTMSMWLNYIQNSMRPSYQDRFHLLHGVDLYTSSGETLGEMFNLLQKHFQFSKPEMVMNYFLKPFFNLSEDEKLMGFLDTIYKNKAQTVPESMYLVINNFRPDFKAHYEAHLLEHSVEQNNHVSKKMKI
jgi:hypothetical protein